MFDDDATWDREDVADGYVILDPMMDDVTDDGPDDDGPDYRDRGYGPDSDPTDDETDSDPTFAAWSILADSDPGAVVTVPAIGSPGPAPMTIVPDDHPERAAVLRSIRDHAERTARESRSKSIGTDPAVGPWSIVDRFSPDADGPRFSPDADDPAALPLGPIPDDAPAPIDVFRATWRKFPRTAPRRAVTGRAPARWEMLAASRLRDRGTAPARIAASIGLSARSAARLAALDADTARMALAGMVDGLPSPDRRRARRVVPYSLDWQTVGPWIDTTGTRSAPDRGHETIPAGTGGEWTNVPGAAPILIPRPWDGPGTLQMVKMGSPRYTGSTARYTRPGGDRRGARVGAEGTAPMIVQWSIRSKVLPAAFVRPMGVEVSPRVMAARRPFPRIDGGRVVWSADGSHVRRGKRGDRTVSHKAGTTVPPAVRTAIGTVRLKGVGMIDPATMTVVPRIVPASERESARIAAVLRGPVPMVGRYGTNEGSAPADSDRIAVRKDGTLRTVRKGSGAGSRGGRKTARS